MRRCFRSSDFRAAELAASKRGRRISVVLPARNEAATVGDIVRAVSRDLIETVPLVDELLVVDDCSSDRTAEVAEAAGAVVVETRRLLPDYPSPGKGQAMWKGVHAASGDLIVFLDADVLDFDTGFVVGLVAPLLLVDDIVMAKGFYERPLAGQPGEGGRVTELAARPALSLLFPHLADLRQPLSGECAAWREVLEAVPFVGGYGVDLGLLIDVTARFGNAGLVECDLGRRVHRNRPLSELGPQALAVVQTVLVRAGVETAGDGRSTLLRPGADPVMVHHTETPPLADVPAHRKTA